MTTPGSAERELTLRTAAARLDELRMRSVLASLDDEARPVGAVEALEVLTLSEVLIRKALHGRQLDVRAARRAGASWSQIGAALGVSKEAAREAHQRWLDGQAALHEQDSRRGLDPAQAEDVPGD